MRSSKKPDQDSSEPEPSLAMLLITIALLLAASIALFQLGVLWH